MHDNRTGDLIDDLLKIGNHLLVIVNELLSCGGTSLITGYSIGIFSSLSSSSSSSSMINRYSVNNN